MQKNFVIEKKSGSVIATENTSLIRKLGAHKGILVLLLFAAALIFPNLGKNALWNDEGDNAYWGLSIKKSGLPVAWDGRNFSSEDLGRLTDNLVMVTLPWLPLYATAASMSVFGETTWAARFPFALAGWATVLALYLLVWRATKDKKTALYSAGMLLLCVPFLLYTRSCRYYAFVMLFTCLALWAFLKLDDRRKAPVFALLILLLFYSLYLPAICVLSALVFLTLVYKPFHKYRRGLWVSLLIVIPCTLPWLLWTYSRFSGDVSALPLSSGELIPRVGQVMIEVGAVAPLLGWVVFLFMRKKDLLKKNAPLLVLCGTVFAVSVFADICMHDAGRMAMLGIRHYCVIIPLAAVISALLVLCTGRMRWQTNVILLLVLGATHLGGNLLPWLVFRLKNPDATPKRAGMIHVPKFWWQIVFRGEIPGYLLELCKDNPGIVDVICQTLLEKASPGDKLLVNYEGESIYFYTRMPQAGKLDPSHPAYQLAKQHKVPDYVFDVGAANWVVWRPIWGSYRNSYSHILRAKVSWQAGKKSVTEVARIKDAGWENRPNLYYHRFPVFGYIYTGAWPNSPPDAIILHVE